jgi:hypothetical protein
MPVGMRTHAWALLRPDAYLVAEDMYLNGHMVLSVAKAFAMV